MGAGGGRRAARPRGGPHRRRSRSGARAGLLAAGIAAFYPELVWFAAHFWSETLFLVLLWWAIERLLAADTRGLRADGGRRGPAVGAGHPDARDVLYFTPLAALWLAWRAPRPAGGTRAAAFAAVRGPGRRALDVSATG